MSTAGMRMQAKSKAVPFLSQPENLDGSMAGDVGFDPFGFSGFFDVKWLREAELKHGRICMFAATGCLVQVRASAPLLSCFSIRTPRLPYSMHTLWLLEQAIPRVNKWLPVFP